jgi:TfoX/Sxy family transcriptional regulator of competence genes
MATQASTVDYIAEQIGPAGIVSARKMFGEYAVFCNGKMVALIIKDELFVKPTGAGRDYLQDVTERPPYRGAKPHFWISGDRWDDQDWLSALIRTTADALPVPVKKPRKRKAPAAGAADPPLSSRARRR